eukprot:2360412-Pleurochrysis_carterae.AAC.2
MEVRKGEGRKEKADAGKRRNIEGRGWKCRRPVRERARKSRDSAKKEKAQSSKKTGRRRSREKEEGAKHSPDKDLSAIAGAAARSLQFYASPRVRQIGAQLANRRSHRHEESGCLVFVAKAGV